jgi:hypothetical protein
MNFRLKWSSISMIRAEAGVEVAEERVSSPRFLIEVKSLLHGW